MKQVPSANPRKRCYECFRPQEACFCNWIPRIENRTRVLIVQHRRERTHPFNTARIVQKALCNSHLLADHTDRLARRLELAPRAGLLYPGPTSRLISDLSTEERPEQLVILDGTWHQAKTLLREIPALQDLPRYRLAPVEPSRYRIRRAPSFAALSTAEAAVGALQILEPETHGFDELLGAFDRMVEAQLIHPGSKNGQRFRARSKRTFKNVPLALLGDLKNIVVAYGESTPGRRGCKRVPEPPLSWIAQRLGTGETFACTLIPPRPLDDVFLRHLGLAREDFAAALPLDEARRQWARFQRREDVVVVFYPGVARLFRFLAGDSRACLVLKSVDLAATDSAESLEGLAPVAMSHSSSMRMAGRAGQRLAMAIALVRHLNGLAKSAAGEHVLVH